MSKAPGRLTFVLRMTTADQFVAELQRQPPRENLSSETEQHPKDEFRRLSWEAVNAPKNLYDERSAAIGKRFGRMKTRLRYGPCLVFHSIRKAVSTRETRARASQEEIGRLISGFDTYKTDCGDTEYVPYAAATNWWSNSRSQTLGTQGPRAWDGLEPHAARQANRRVNARKMSRLDDLHMH
jgi:hypothetical protein